MKNNLNAKEGDFIEVKGEVANILKYTFIVYMIPFAATILGIVLGNYFFKNQGYANYEILSFLTGVVFLAISFFIVKLIDKRIANKGESAISLVRIL